MNSIDTSKPYCGNCGAQDIPLRRLPLRGDDEQHVCKDPNGCRARRAAL